MLVLVIVTLAPGQNLEPAPTSEVTPLVSKQEMIRDRIARFEDRMFRLREKLLDEEPENAARLADALNRAGELGVNERLETVLRFLSEDSRMDEAADLQDRLRVDLASILESLMEKRDDAEARKEEITRLEEIKAKLDELLQQQKELRSDTGKTGERKRLSAQLSEAIRKLDELIRRQEAARDSAEGLDPADGAAHETLQKSQGDIAQDTQALAQDIKKMGASSQGGASSGGEGGDPSEATEAAAADMESAGEHMDQAEAELGDKEGDTAAAEQKKAIEDLRRARHRLEEAKKALDEDDYNKKLAKGQHETADKAGALSKKMQGGSQQGEQGGQQGGQQGGEQGGDQPAEPTPGQQQVEKAEQHMEDAAEDLDDANPRDATADQDAALAELEDAMAELEEALRQLRQEEQEEVLRDLEGRFREMLAKQLEINTGTRELHDFGRDNFRRAENLRAAELSESEQKLSRDASTCRHVLEEEGTTVVFPAILEQLSDDMRDISDRLGKLDVAMLTQAMQDEVVAILQSLVDAIEEKQKEMDSNSQSGQAGSDEQPLLPTSAELKLLRSMQVQTKHRTDAIESERQTGTQSSEALRASTAVVTRRQLDVAEIAQEMHALEAMP